jgi:hypothetical protein
MLGVVTGLLAVSHAGLALLLAVTAVAGALVLLPHGRLWSLPALAPLIGLIGLAGAWPALAGRSGWGWSRRAGVAAAGYLWSVGAGAVAGRDLLWLPANLPLHAAWAGSPAIGSRDVLGPIVAGGVLPAAAVWAAAAVVLPWIARGRRPALDVVMVCAWAAGTVSAVEACGARPLHSAAAGAVVAGLIALLPAGAKVLRRAGMEARVP